MTGMCQGGVSQVGDSGYSDTAAGIVRMVIFFVIASSKP